MDLVYAGRSKTLTTGNTNQARAMKNVHLQTSSLNRFFSINHCEEFFFLYKLFNNIGWGEQSDKSQEMTV